MSRSSRPGESTALEPRRAPRRPIRAARPVFIVLPSLVERRDASGRPEPRDVSPATAAVPPTAHPPLTPPPPPTPPPPNHLQGRQVAPDGLRRVQDHRGRGQGAGVLPQHLHRHEQGAGGVREGGQVRAAPAAVEQALGGIFRAPQDARDPGGARGAGGQGGRRRAVHRRARAQEDEAREEGSLRERDRRRHRRGSEADRVHEAHGAALAAAHVG